jgi:S-formylglutathione hydrolase FrmB
MPHRFKSSLVAITLLASAFLYVGAQDSGCKKPIRFRITLDPEITSKDVSGRLLVFMAESKNATPPSFEFVRNNGWVAAMEVDHFVPGQAFEFNPDLKSYPHPFSSAGVATYQFAALLDSDHSYAYNGQNDGDWFGPVVTVENLDPSNTLEIGLTLGKQTETKAQAVDTEIVKFAEFQSPLLTRFWGRPIRMRAAVLLPTSFNQSTFRTYPAIYDVHGFGGNHIQAATRRTDERSKQMVKGKHVEMVTVLLDGSFPTGHHEFADSVNNGPWGQALTEEFIPYLEKRFRLIPKPHARFLTGHSSGGWSTLWLQITYPNYFGGTWSTAPDPVDLRSFTGVNLTPNSTDNMYRKADGTARNLVRQHGKLVTSFEEFAKKEDVLGEYSGQMASFEWVWSPKGRDGRPMKLFNRETGDQDPFVQQAWQKYDIRLILEKNWSSLGPKLRGKIHVICGTEDTFHLEEAVVLLCDFLKAKGFGSACEMVPGRDHGNLYQSYKTYPDGLYMRIVKDMEAMFRVNNQTITSHRRIPTRKAKETQSHDQG